MSTPRPRIRLGSRDLAPGESTEVLTLISHPMETGRREGPDGAPVPRDMIARFEASFDGAPVFAVEMGDAISTDPFLSFHLAPPHSGTLRLVWTLEDGTEITAEEAVTVA